jgi:hypothetical protein
LQHLSCNLYRTSIIIAGDISPHSYPDDSRVINEYTSIKDLCLTKFYATKILLQQLVSAYPDTRWAYSIGNNDHFPKNVYWQPYIDLLGEMMLEIGFFTQQQYDQFVRFGSSFTDVQGVRYVCIDMTLFVPNGEVILAGQASVVPNLLQWMEESLQDAEKSGLAIYFVGHQPLSTRFGVDELDVDSPHFLQLKETLTKHAANIRVGLFGHNNLANVVQVLSPSPESRPIFPAIVATGVSPRAPNQPSFNVFHKCVYMSAIHCNYFTVIS